MTIVRPETLVRWRRAGFRRYRRWKSRKRGGRPRIEIELGFRSADKNLSELMRWRIAEHLLR
jgi:hypothetical protein